MATNWNNMMMNPMLMGGLSLLAGGTQRRQRQTPMQDLMMGLGIASSMQQSQKQREMYDLQKQEFERKQQEMEARQKYLGGLMSGDPELQKAAAIQLMPEEYAKSLIKPQQQFKVLTNAEEKRLGLDPKMQYKMDMSTGNVSSIGAGPTINIQTAKPLSPGDLYKFWNPETGQTAQPGDTMQDIIDKGLVPMPPFAEKAADRKRTFANLNSTITEYENLIDKYGAEVMPGEAKGLMKGAKNRLTMGLKEYDELGAPQAGDLMLLAEAVTDMTTIGAKLSEPFAKAQAKAQLKQLKRQLALSENIIRRSLGQPEIEVPEAGTDEEEEQQQPGTYQVPDDIRRMIDEATP